MKSLSGQTRLAATDLSNHLACRHLTTLDLQVARGAKQPPDWAAPHLVVIRELGKKHETAYLQYLAQHGLSVANLADIADEQTLLRETRSLMAQGAGIIAQGALAHGNWFGRPDVLKRVPAPGAQWNWSYEIADTKLAPETKASTILQLSLYSELLGAIQGCLPEWMWVVPPGKDFHAEKYRVSDYSAYFRYVKKRLEQTVQNTEAGGTYPEPVPHCDVCRWFRECDARRRNDDHLSLVAGIHRRQRNQLEQWNTDTMAALAALPVPLRQRPDHGSREALERVREQARVQVQGRAENKLVCETLSPVVQGAGFCRLPEPSIGDVFLDIEGDPFVAESGLQYLFGFAVEPRDGGIAYEKRWALNREDEKQAFEWLVDQIVRLREAHPAMHIYHFGSYEPPVLKRLMGMHATREDQIDRLLRAGALIDLHLVFKQGLRASVEEYSLKKLEPFYAFQRQTPLDRSRLAMRFVEHRLELGSDQPLPQTIRETMEGYNRDDCLSAMQLRAWLERHRDKLVQAGAAVPRPPPKTGDPAEHLKEKLGRTARLTQGLCEHLPAGPQLRSPEQAAQWLLAQLLSWHRREEKRTWQEGYRLAEMDDGDLRDERAGLTNLRFLKRVDAGNDAPTDRYAFEPQKTNVRAGKDLYFADLEHRIGEVAAIDPAAGILEIKKTGKTAGLHPPAVFMWDRPLRTDAQAGSLYRIGDWVAANGIDAPGRYRAGHDLLLRKPPALEGTSLSPLPAETPQQTAARVVLALGDSVFAIQGPPGSGKTYTGARMICELLKRGKKIGVTALSHKVIRNLLETVVEAAREKDVPGVKCLHRETNGEESDGVAVATKQGKQGNEQALAALRSGAANVLGGTSWLWSPPESFESLDVLFIDEAGQMSLADVLAVSQAAKKLVLLGDPQQLERPIQGSHPGGAEKSALEHLLDGRKTIPGHMGFLLPQTWRLHPEVCKFTSSVFYEEKLTSHAIACNRFLAEHPWLTGPGLYFVPVQHTGNCNSSAEEVEIVAQIVESLLKPEVKWFYSSGNSRRLKPDDILIIAPFNAQVADLSLRLPAMRAGTVDKFQGQEAAVVIYSLTSSSPEDAPRGMEFLYSLNRLNVATSRAMSNVIVTGSPRLFEPECRSPRQMQLASAFCRFAEMATIVPRHKISAIPAR